MDKEQAKLIEWARKESARLKDWALTNTNVVKAPIVRPIAAGVLEFLRRHAPGTQFLESAENVFRTDSNMYANAAITGMATILDLWIEFVESGMADIQPFVVSARLEAATDLMEQVQQLLNDGRNIHPAAPITLAGAALEEFLRSLVAATSVTVTGKLGINAYAGALRAGNHISAQDMKDITLWTSVPVSAAG
ncbi:hypothetical protein ACOZ38_29425 [Sphaerisporangium viridialbum]|uniref:hypothetical protein n=1 Tax=Sphaerisporangium viridialbum TaxID=46189 RepID=UPI003C72EC53